MKGDFDIGTSKDDDPSATAHKKAVGAVHTYAVGREEREQNRTGQRRTVNLDEH